MSTTESEQPQSLSTESHTVESDIPASGLHINDPISETPERWSRTPKPRGRQPRDPHGQSVEYQCRNADDLERLLREYLKQPTIPAEHATIHFTFPVSAAFMVYGPEIRNTREPNGGASKPQPLLDRLDRTAINVIDVLALTDDPKSQMRTQRAIAKACIEACEKADGYRYSFHNNWLSREDEACRFSFYCNDSTLNKGRAANEGAGTIGKKMVKPAYDCQGLIKVMFSLTKQSLEVQYKHVPLHKTYAERAPHPRRESKRRRLMEILDPESIPRRWKKSIDKPAGRTIQSHPVDALWNMSTTSAADLAVVDLTGQDNLEQVLEFQGPTPERVTSCRQPETNSPIQQPIVSASTEQNLSIPQFIGPKRGQLNKSVVSGIMTGWVRRGHVNLEAPASASVRQHRIDKKTNPSQKPKQSAERSEIGVAAAGPENAEEAGNICIALSELEGLKRKLVEAEARIKRLESEQHAALSQLKLSPREQAFRFSSFGHSPHPYPASSNPGSAAVNQPSSYHPPGPRSPYNYPPQNTPLASPGKDSQNAQGLTIRPTPQNSSASVTRQDLRTTGDSITQPIFQNPSVSVEKHDPRKAQDSDIRPMSRPIVVDKPPESVTISNDWIVFTPMQMPELPSGRRPGRPFKNT